MHQRTSVRTAIAMLTLTALAPAPARASYVGSAITITARAGSTTSTWSANITPAGDGALGDSHSGDGAWTDGWTAANPAAGQSIGGLGTVLRWDATYAEDPVVNLGFYVLNSSSVTVTYTITSSLVSFPTDNFTTSASAQIGITDSDEQLNGATLAGNYPLNKSFRLYCNGMPLADLVPGYSVAPGGGSLGTNDTFGPMNEFGTSSKQSEFSFTLTPGDQASGTNRYTKTQLIPAPTAAGAFLAVGALALSRRPRS